MTGVGQAAGRQIMETPEAQEAVKNTVSFAGKAAQATGEVAGKAAEATCGAVEATAAAAGKAMEDVTGASAAVAGVVVGGIGGALIGATVGAVLQGQTAKNHWRCRKCGARVEMNSRPGERHGGSCAGSERESQHSWCKAG